MEKSQYCLKCGEKLTKDALICNKCKTSIKKANIHFKIEINDINQKECFYCGSKRLIVSFLIYHLGIPPGKEGHNVVYNHIVGVCCLDCGAGFIENLDHDCWSYEEIWDRTEWYLLDAKAIEQLKMLLRNCPNPISSICTCPIHNAIRSEIYNLPIVPWKSISVNQKNIQKFNKSHIHHVSLKIKNSLPVLEVIKGEND